MVSSQSGSRERDGDKIGYSLQVIAIAVAIIGILVGATVYYGYNTINTIFGIPSGNTKTVTSYSTQTIIITTTQTVTQITTAPPPQLVDVKGKVATLTPGTYPISITFETSTGITSNPPLNSSGFYFVRLNNLQNYTVTIQWNRVIGGGGSTVCGKFNLIVGAGTQSLRMDWSC